MIVTPVSKEMLLAREVLPLYRHFRKFDQLEDQDIFNLILPSIRLRQFAKHYHQRTLVGFTNWALMSDEAEQHYKQHGYIEAEDWHSGDNIWHMETVAISHLRDIMRWTKNNMTRTYGLGRVVKWSRNTDDLKIKRFNSQPIRRRHVWAAR